MQRWITDLSDFDFEVIYKTGKTNTDADTLSRYGMQKGNVTFNFGAFVAERIGAAKSEKLERKTRRNNGRNTDHEFVS